jgi:Ni,Fe-hydrogenase maturation factor
MPDILLIGYGNELRGDDAAGPWVARDIERRQIPGVRTLAVHQLTPELAEPISQAQAVIFIDACVSPETRDPVSALPGQGTEILPSPEASPLPAIIPIAPAAASGIPTHLGNPRFLLGLAMSLYAHCPPAWLVTIPAAHLDFGETFSLSTRASIDKAVVAIQELISTIQAEGIRIPPSRAGE